MTSGPTITKDQVDELCDWLSAKDWAFASEVVKAFGTDDRTVRAWAAGSDGRVISSQKGYKLTANATREEIEHAVNWLRSQAKQMSERATQIEVTSKLLQTP